VFVPAPPTCNFSRSLLGFLESSTRYANISRSAGLSYGVLYQGQIIHTEHFGYCDVEAKVKPDDDTLYYIGSLTKAITATAVGILVDDGKIAWDTQISDFPPEFHRRNEDLNTGTITDLLAHRMGFASENCFWIQGNQRLLLPKDQKIPITNYLESVIPFRSTWKYSN
jgi:CubicO group peptidase (beta-lactamase class C family)